MGRGTELKEGEALFFFVYIYIACHNGGPVNFIISAVSSQFLWQQKKVALVARYGGGGGSSLYVTAVPKVTAGDLWLVWRPPRKYFGGFAEA